MIRGLNAQSESQLSPGFYFFLMKLGNELKQRKGAETLALTLRRRPEGFSQGGRVYIQGHGGIAVKNEAYVRILNARTSDRPIR